MTPRRNPSSGRVLLLLALACVVTFALLVGVSMLTSEDPPGAGGDVERETSRLRAEFAARDAAQVRELTSVARRVRDDLSPVLEGMSETLPPDGPPSERVADAGDIERWREGLRDASAEFGNPPSGETATNVARGSLDAATDLLDSSVLTYEQAAGLPAEQRRPFLERAASQRDLAVRVWSIGATQLDAVNVETGNGHQHVYLAANGVDGALSADPAPEGSEAHEDHE